MCFRYLNQPFFLFLLLIPSSLPLPFFFFQTEKVMDELHSFRRQVKEEMTRGHVPLQNQFEWMAKVEDYELDFHEFWQLTHIIRNELIYHSHSIHHDNDNDGAKHGGGKGGLKEEIAGFDIEESMTSIFKHFAHEAHSDTGEHVELDDHTHNVMVRWLFLFCAIVSDDENNAVGAQDQKKIVAALDALGIPKLLVFLASTKHAQTASTACDLAIELLKVSPFETAIEGIQKDADGNAVAHTQKQFFEVLSGPGSHARRLLLSLKHRIEHEKDHLIRKTIGEEEDDVDDGSVVHQVHRTAEFSTLLSLLEMLKYCTMGCYTPMQDLLRHQSDDHPINVLALVCEFAQAYADLIAADMKETFSIPAGTEDKEYPLAALKEMQDKEDEIQMLIQIYQFLTESVSGPNELNQTILIDLKVCTPVINVLRFQQSGEDVSWESIDDNVLDVREDLGEWCATFAVSRANDGVCAQEDGMDEMDELSTRELEQVERLFEVLVSLDTIDEECESSVISFLHALTEGRNPGAHVFDFIIEQLLKDCDLKKPKSWNQGTIFSNLTSHAKAAPKKIDKDKVSAFGRRIVTDDETALGYHMLIANISTGSFLYGKDLSTTLREWDKAMHNPFKNRVARIEIVRSGVLSALYFPVPEIVLRTLASEMLIKVKEDIISNTLLLNDQERVREFLRSANVITTVIKQQDYFQRSWLLRAVVYEQEISWVALICAGILNVHFIVGVGSESGSHTLLKDRETLGWEVLGYFSLGFTVLQFVSYMVNHLSIDRYAYTEKTQHTPAFWSAPFASIWSFLSFWVLSTRVTYFALSIISTAMGNFISPGFFVFGLYELVERVQVMKMIIHAIFVSAPKLAGTVLLAALILYTFAVIGVTAFGGQYQFPDINSYCADANATFSQCLMDHFFTFGSAMAFVEVLPNFSGFLYGVVYNIIMVLLVANIFVGVITDTLSEIRGRQEAFDAAKKNYCFVCSHSRAELEAACDVGFEGHLTHEHNPWDFIAFLIHVTERFDRHEHLTGPELQFLKASNADKLHECWPTQRALCIDGDKAREDSYDLRSVCARIDAVAAMAKGTATQVSVALRALSVFQKITSLDNFALLQACASGDLAQVEDIIDQGVDVNCADYDDRTPLHLAAAEGRALIVSMLLEKGAKINVTDRFGRTPMDEANKNGNAVVKKRLQAGASKKV